MHFRLRIPEDLKEKVEQASAENHRSMTAEIVARLEDSFRSPYPMLPEGLREELAIQAKSNMRSVNGEMIHRLIDSLNKDQALDAAVTLANRLRQQQKLMLYLLDELHKADGRLSAEFMAVAREAFGE